MGLAVFKVFTRFADLPGYLFPGLEQFPSPAHQEAPLRRYVADEALHSNELAQLLLSQHRSKVLSGREDSIKSGLPHKNLEENHIVHHHYHLRHHENNLAMPYK